MGIFSELEDNKHRGIICMGVLIVAIWFLVGMGLVASHLPIGGETGAVIGTVLFITMLIISAYTVARVWASAGLFKD